jgi:HAD superfamily hydrolase (TIGR01509 family)
MIVTVHHPGPARLVSGLSVSPAYTIFTTYRERGIFTTRHGGTVINSEPAMHDTAARRPHGDPAGPAVGPPQAVIFDRDGVLTQFDLAAAAAYFQPLLPITLDQIIGRWIAWTATRALPQGEAGEQASWQGFWDSVSDDLALAPRIRAQLHACDFLTFLRPYADARPALEVVAARGLRSGVLSNFALGRLDESLAQAGLADLVAVAAASSRIGASKPQPAAYLWIARALQVPPAACLLFDDELPGVEGARAVGMEAYLVDRRRAAHALAEGVVRDLTALPAILEQRTRAVAQAPS